MCSRKFCHLEQVVMNIMCILTLETQCTYNAYSLAVLPLIFRKSHVDISLQLSYLYELLRINSFSKSLSDLPCLELYSFLQKCIYIYTLSYKSVYIYIFLRFYRTWLCCLIRTVSAFTRNVICQMSRAIILSVTLLSMDDLFLLHARYYERKC